MTCNEECFRMLLIFEEYEGVVKVTKGIFMGLSEGMLVCGQLPLLVCKNLGCEHDCFQEEVE